MTTIPLNILVVSNCAFDEFQGSGYVIVNTMRCLERLGHRVSGADNSTLLVAKWMRGRANRYRMALGMARFVLKKRNRLSTTDLIIFYGAECFLAIWCLKHLIRYKGKTILHSNGIEMQVDRAMIRGNVNRFQSVFQWNMHPFFKYSYQNIHRLITVSEYERDFALRQLKLSNDRVSLLEPSLHDLFFKENQPLMEKKPVIMYCGGWLPIKGVDAIKKALPGVLERFPDYRLLLVGVGHSFKKGDYFPVKVQNQIDVIPYVRDRKRLISLFLECSFFIFPSLADSFGLVVAEAMHSKCVAIVSRTGFGYSLIHGQEAWVLDVPTGKALADALSYLLCNEETCSQIRQIGSSRVKNLRWEVYQNNLENVLNNLFNPRLTAVTADGGKGY